MSKASKNLYRIPHTSKLMAEFTIERFAGAPQHSREHERHRSQFRTRGRNPPYHTSGATPMSEHVCPWWIGYFLVSPMRRWLQNPDEVIRAYVTPGMTVVEPGPGMGFFTLPLARRVGSGRVIAVDIQAKMLSALRRRATKAGLIQRIETRLAQPGSLGIHDLKGTVDFILAAAMVHEVPSAERFFVEAAEALAAGGG